MPEYMLTEIQLKIIFDNKPWDDLAVLQELTSKEQHQADVDWLEAPCTEHNLGTEAPLVCPVYAKHHKDCQSCWEKFTKGE